MFYKYQKIEELVERKMKCCELSLSSPSKASMKIEELGEGEGNVTERNSVTYFAQHILAL